MVKISGFARNLLTVIAILVLMWAAGFICSESGIMGNYPPVTTRFNADVQVIDDNGSPVPNQTVYALFCLQKPSGWFSPGSADNFSGYGITDSIGYAEIESANVTLTRGDILWMGVSTEKARLDSGYAGKSFSPGEWARYNYTDIMHIGGMNISGYARVMFVRNSDGRMMDADWLINRPWYDYSVNKTIDGFRYMDNRSWNFDA